MRRAADPRPPLGQGVGQSAADTNPDEPDPEGEVTGVLQSLNVVPYRAGYEDHDRRQIQERLAEGTLNGVVSTSALELGIDVPTPGYLRADRRAFLGDLACSSALGALGGTARAR